MERPEIELIKESLPLVDERTAKGTVMHLVEYIEYLEDLVETKGNEIISLIRITKSCVK